MSRTIVRRGEMSHFRIKAGVPVMVYAPGTRPSTAVGGRKVVGRMTRAQAQRINQQRAKQFRGRIVANRKNTLGTYI